jgi:hypothetical protein
MLRTNRRNRPSWIFSDRTWDDDAVVERPETVRNISLDEPSRPHIGTVASYFASCQGMLGFGLDLVGEVGGVGDPLSTRELNFRRKVNVLPATGTSTPGHMPDHGPVVDSIGVYP